MIIRYKEPNLYKCEDCNLSYVNKNEYIFHSEIECPERTRTPYYMTERHTASKKRSACYRCGRIGHYYRRNECYATKDVDGNLITWGHAKNLDREKPRKKIGTYSSINNKMKK